MMVATAASWNPPQLGPALLELLQDEVARDRLSPGGIGASAGLTVGRSVTEQYLAHLPGTGLRHPRTPSPTSGHRMNVAIFASAFFPHMGGVEELCRQLAHEYQARQMESGGGDEPLAARFARVRALRGYSRDPPAADAYAPDSGWKSRAEFLRHHRAECNGAHASHPAGGKSGPRTGAMCVGCNAFYAAKCGGGPSVYR